MYVELETVELALAFKWGQERATIMAAKQNKAGYPAGTFKGGSGHTPQQNEALGIAAEIAACKLFNLDYNDPSVYVAVAQLDVHGNLPKACKQPDVAGVYEVRRTEKQGYPIRMWKKDKTADAFVLQAVVEHTHLDSGFIRPTGRVLFVGWTSAKLDYDKYKNKAGVAERYVKKSMETLPGLFVGFHRVGLA